MSIDEKAFEIAYAKHSGRTFSDSTEACRELIALYEAAKVPEQSVGISKRMYSDIAEEHQYAKSNLENKLLEFGLTDWDNLWTDPYDNSIELDNVDNENRLSPEAQKYLSDEGFSICWLTHKDGMETAYYKLAGEEGSRKKSHRVQKRESIADMCKRLGFSKTPDALFEEWLREQKRNEIEGDNP